MRISNIKNALVSAISGITDFVSVLGYQKFEDIGFPSVAILYRGSESEQREMGRNLETHKFDLEVRYCFNDNQDAETILIDLVEKVVDKIDEDRTLGGYSQNLTISDISEAYMEDADKIKAFVFSIEATVFKPL